MSEVLAVRKNCGAEKNPAKCEQNRGSRVSTNRLRKNTRETTSTPVAARSAPVLSEKGLQQGKTDRALRKSVGSAAAAQTPNGGDAQMLEPVLSVTELALMICGDPENRKKRLRLAEALREYGLDERRAAAVYAGTVEKLSRNKEGGAVGVAAAKLLLDVLKEVTHSLEPQKIAGGNDSSDVPQFVRLIHNVPRPVRTE